MPDPFESLVYLGFLLGLDTADLASTIAVLNAGGVEVNPAVNKLGLVPASAIQYGVDIGLVAWFYYIPLIANQFVPLSGDVIEWVTKIGIWILIGWKGITVAGNIKEILENKKW